MTVPRIQAGILALVFLVGLAWRHDAEAQDLNMTVPAGDADYLDVIVSANNKGEPKITYRGNNRNEIGKWKETDWQSKYAMLSFSISSIPDSAELKTCQIRLVLSADVPNPPDTQVVGTILTASADTDGGFQNFVRKATKRVEPGTKRGRPVVLSGKPLCSVIEAKLKAVGDPERVVRFFLSTETRDGEAAVYTSPDAADPSVRPRLVLSYNSTRALLADADWTQIRHDAQHSGRSAWKIYDNPAGDFSGFKVSPLGAQKFLSIPLSPMLYGGMLVAAKEETFSIAALDQKGNQFPGMESNTKGQSRVSKYLVAGPNGLLYDSMENFIEAFDLRRTFSSSTPETITSIGTSIGGQTRESQVNVPTIGSAGSLFIVTSAFVRAYSAPPNARELWRYSTGQGNVSAVTLSEDEGTAYVLFGPSGDKGQNRLVALDAATGACRWTSSKDIAIIVQPNGAMPNPVVTGRDIYFTDEFPLGKKLYAFRDEKTMPDPAGAENCAEGAPNGRTAYNVAAPTPVAGRSKEAIYVNQGQLCWARELQNEVCSAVDGCAQDELAKITLLIGDSSDIPNAKRLYGIDPTNKRLFVMKATYSGQEPKHLAARCHSTTVQNLGPNLVLGPDGTLYNYSNENSKLLAIAPSSWRKKGDAGGTDTGDTLVLTPEIVGMTKDACTQGNGPTGPNNGTAFLAEKIVTDTDLCLPAGTDVILSAAKTIGFRNGFTVKAGARLRAKVGIVQ
jgi:hypothetical protein